MKDGMRGKHWCCLGKARLVSDSQIWFHWSWRLGFKCLASVYSEVEPDTQYSIWVSAKLQGPAYSPGSKKDDAVAVDRIIVIKE